MYVKLGIWYIFHFPSWYSITYIFIKLITLSLHSSQIHPKSHKHFNNACVQIVLCSTNYA